jgi:hypothetical protein
VNFWQEYSDDGLEVIAIDSDEGDVLDIPGLTAYVDWLGPPTYPVATETPGEGTYAQFSAIYEGSNPFPLQILIDKQGIVRYVAREYDPYNLDLLVQELLAEPP